MTSHRCIQHKMGEGMVTLENTRCKMIEEIASLQGTHFMMIEVIASHQGTNEEIVSGQQAMAEEMTSHQGKCHCETGAGMSSRRGMHRKMAEGTTSQGAI